MSLKNRKEATTTEDTHVNRMNEKSGRSWVRKATGGHVKVTGRLLNGFASPLPPPPPQRRQNSRMLNRDAVTFTVKGALNLES